MGAPDMWSAAERVANDLLRLTGHLDREQWIAVFTVALVVGAFLMRGFGKRI